MGLNPRLLALAQNTVWKQASGEKRAAGAGAPGDPAAQGGAMGGGMPAGAPPGAGGAPMAPPPGMSPAPMQGMMPGMDPSMGMGGMMGGGMGGMPGQGMQGQQKVKPEQWMQQLDYRLYNMQQLLTALANTMQVQIPPGALIMPPGTPMAPPMEAALPGGQADPTQAPGAGAGQSAISPIEPIPGASPELAQAGAGAGGGAGAAPGGGGGKQAAASPLANFAASLFDDPAAHVGSPYGEPSPESDIQSNAATVAALLRSRTAQAA